MNSSHYYALGLATTLALGTAQAEPFPDPSDLPARPEPPDPLVFFDGSPVKTRDDWTQRRRPELKRLFQHYMYGVPPPPPKVVATVTKTDATLLGGKATLKEVEIRFPDLKDDAPRIRLALFLPNQVKGPAPVFLGLNWCGNHAVVGDPAVTIHPAAWSYPHCKQPPEANRGGRAYDWELDTLLGRGYAAATFASSDIDPDKNDFGDGIHPHFPDLPGPKESRWGAIAAWAWGLHRAVDYLVTDPQIDKTRIAVIGHSRQGKTALLAAALDERIALVVPHQSGTGGAALSRDNDQETVKRINTSFPHWFNGVFKQFNDRVEKLPVDQHLLMALVAPRPLLDTEGDQDRWANYDNALRSLKGADKVYKFLGAPGVVGSGVVRDDEDTGGSGVGNLAQYRRDSKHVMSKEYWRAVLAFADRWLPGK